MLRLFTVYLPAFQSKKRRGEATHRAFFVFCRWLRQSHLSFSRLPFPTGKATSRYREVRACTQRVSANGCLPRSLRLRVAEKRFVGQLHLLPGTLHPQRNFWKQSNYPRQETLIPRVVALERNDLGGFG